MIPITLPLSVNSTLRRLGTLTLVALLAACGSNRAPDTTLGTKPEAVGSFEGKDGGAEKIGALTVDRVSLANYIWGDDYILLNRTHGGYGITTDYDNDGATSIFNIIDTKLGKISRTSTYRESKDLVGGGTGGNYLSVSMLQGMIKAEQKSKGAIEISEITGGTHRPGSLHFRGLAFDVSAIDRTLSTVNGIIHRENGNMYNANKTSGATVRELYNRYIWSRHDESYQKILNVVNACREAGASEVYYPGRPYNKPGDHDDHIHCGWAR